MAVRSFRSYRPTKPELAVFVSGITSMGLEILAVRIIAPQFGSHIYTIGAILTVFLTALSLGYWRGGRRAAENASVSSLRWLILLTAVYVAFVVFSRDYLVTSTATLPLPSQYASIPAIVVLFGPPTYFLGFVSPYAAELSKTASVGEASGHVYALGTIGSIIGSAATTFVLIPIMGVEEIGLLFGLLLVGTALALARPNVPRSTAVSALLVTSVLFAAVAGGSVGLDPRGTVVHEEQTAHQTLEIVDDGEVRTMYLDGARHSAMDLDDPDRHVFTYTRYFHLPYLYADDPDDVDDALFVGGGGYTGPQNFVEEDDGVEVDVVEIDPAVTQAAEDYFGLDHENEPRLSVYEDDGRSFLDDLDETAEYDVIVLDAFKQDTAPFELTTLEFMELVESHLSDDGVFIANVISAPEGPAADFYEAQYATMDEAFANVDSYPTADDPTSVQNVQLVATVDGDPPNQAELAERNGERDPGADLDDAIGNQERDVAVDDAPVLRDDNAPVDALLDPMIDEPYVIDETEPADTADD